MTNLSAGEAPRAAPVERAFRETIDALQKAWTTKARLSEHFDWITWT